MKVVEKLVESWKKRKNRDNVENPCKKYTKFKQKWEKVKRKNSLKILFRLKFVNGQKV